MEKYSENRLTIIMPGTDGMLHLPFLLLKNLIAGTHSPGEYGIIRVDKSNYRISEELIPEQLLYKTLLQNLQVFFKKAFD